MLGFVSDVSSSIVHLFVIRLHRNLGVCPCLSRQYEDEHIVLHLTRVVLRENRCRCPREKGAVLRVTCRVKQEVNAVTVSHSLFVTGCIKTKKYNIIFCSSIFLPLYGVGISF